jgi:hypothetical protein
MSRNLIISALIFPLMSCATVSDRSGTYIYDIKKGETFVLKKDINITARKAHVILQDGTIKDFENTDKYAPWCRFEVNKLGTQTIKPDTFTITDVEQNQVNVMPGTFNYYVKFDLSAPNNKNVLNIACGAWGSTQDWYLTFPQMQQALGGYFEIPSPK